MSGDAKFFLGVVISAVVIIGAIIAFSTHNKASSGTVTVDTTLGQKLGPDDAKVKIVEFGDLQCPACAAAATEFRNVQKNNPDVQIIFRYFPLIEIHKNAQIAAQAAEAAGKQDKFWQFYDVMYERQTQWESDTDPTGRFSGYATELGMDGSRFVSDMNSDDAKNVVKRDLDFALASNFNQTPTFVINGKVVVGGQTASDWQKLVAEAK